MILLLQNSVKHKLLLPKKYYEKIFVSIIKSLVNYIKTYNTFCNSKKGAKQMKENKGITMLRLIIIIIIILVILVGIIISAMLGENGIISKIVNQTILIIQRLTTR